MGCPYLREYYTTKFVICQYALRNFFYEIRNFLPFCVLNYYGKRDTIPKRKGVKTYDKVQSQSDACPAGNDPKGTGRKDGYPSAHGVRHLRGNGEALARRCLGEDLRSAGLPARRPDGVCAGRCSGIGGWNFLNTFRPKCGGLPPALPHPKVSMKADV